MAGTLPAYAAALQAALAGEHATIWACGRAAGELSGEQRTEALRSLDAHRVRREALRGALVDLGAEPVAPAAAYVEPFAVRGARGGRRLMAHVERALAATYSDVAAAAPAGARSPWVGQSSKAAVRALGWGAAPQAFPGSAEQVGALPAEGDQS